MTSYERYVLFNAPLSAAEMSSRVSITSSPVIGQRQSAVQINPMSPAGTAASALMPTKNAAGWMIGLPLLALPFAATAVTSRGHSLVSMDVSSHGAAVT